MPRRELLLDGRLTLEEPVHRAIQLVLVGIRHTQILRERIRMPPPRGRELRVRSDDSRGDHCHDEIHFATRSRGQQVAKTEPAHCDRHRLRVAVRNRSCDLECEAGRSERLALESTTNQLDHVGGKMGEIADRLVLHLAVFAIAATEQMALVDLVFVLSPCRDDMDSAISARHAYQYQNLASTASILVTTVCTSEPDPFRRFGPSYAAHSHFAAPGIKGTSV